MNRFGNFAGVIYIVNNERLWVILLAEKVIYFFHHSVILSNLYVRLCHPTNNFSVFTKVSKSK